MSRQKSTVFESNNASAQNTPSAAGSHARKASTIANESPLIQPTLLNSFLHRLQSHFARRFERIPAEVERAYFGVSQSPQSSSSSSPRIAHDEHRRALALMLANYDLPHPQRLRSFQDGRVSDNHNDRQRPTTSFVQLALRYPHVSPSLLSAIHHFLLSA